MILVTVGTQLGFDRLIRAVDTWIGEHPDTAAFAQIGRGSYEPDNVRWERFVSPDEFGDLVGEASLLVAHAGFGSILTALRAGKPIVILPRRAAMGEHRNDHQLATAEAFASYDGVHTVLEESGLASVLDQAASLARPEMIGEYAPPTLLDPLRRFIVG